MDTLLLNSKKALLIVFRLFGWALFIYITMPLINWTEHPNGNIFPWVFVASCLFLVAYFYLNNCIFVPHFLSKKRIVLFLGITIVSYILFCFIIPYVVHQCFIPELPFRPDMPSGVRPDFTLQSGRRMNLLEIIRYFGFSPLSSQFLAIFIISTGLKAVSQWYAEKQHLQELEISLVQAELSFLKSQIHPHFLFNNLNSIYCLALSKDDKASEVILSLSNFLRFVTTESNQNRIPLEKEVKMLEEYIHLQRLRVSEKFELQLQEKGDFQSWTIMPLVFVPFIENAFKYGISAHINCFIHIYLEVENGFLTFTCDNSIVSEINDRNHSSGIGQENIRKRLELAYPGQHSLAISADSLAFHIKLQINLA